MLLLLLFLLWYLLLSLLMWFGVPVVFIAPTVINAGAAVHIVLVIITGVAVVNDKA